MLPSFDLNLYDDLDPAPRLLMGPGPIDADPRVLRAMSVPLLGQFDPQFRRFMAETQTLLRRVFQTENEATLLIDGTARSAIEAAMVSLIEPGDVVLVASFGRFGQLKAEIAARVGADVRVVECPWGSVFDTATIEAALIEHRPSLLAVCHGDTSTTMAQPLAEIARLARDHNALLLVDATATLGGMDLAVDALGIDVCTAGLQKCLAGPPGIAPITLSPVAVERIRARRHVEAGIRTASDLPANGKRITSNYFDLAMILDYWSDRALNHHTEATSMLYAARECARILVKDGLGAAIARHALAGHAMASGLAAMGLALYGDQANKMPNVTGVHIPAGIDGDGVRQAMLDHYGIEIGTSFGPLHGKIWRLGTMGYNARRGAVMTTLAALEACLVAAGAKVPQGAGTSAALGVFQRAGSGR